MLVTATTEPVEAAPVFAFLLLLGFALSLAGLLLMYRSIKQAHRAEQVLAKAEERQAEEVQKAQAARLRQEQLGLSLYAHLLRAEEQLLSSGSRLGDPSTETGGDVRADPVDDYGDALLAVRYIRDTAAEEGNDKLARRAQALLLGQLESTLPGRAQLAAQLLNADREVD